MYRLLFLFTCAYLPSLIFAQITPYDQRLYHEWFNLVEFDSIATSKDSGSAFSLIEAIGQDYFFLNNSKISDINWYDQSGQYWKSTGVWNPGYSELYTFDYVVQTDTIEVERFYWDRWNRDSAYESIVNYGLPFESHEVDYYGYDAMGNLKRIHTVDAKTNDTVYFQQYFYDSGSNLDSIIAWNGLGKKLLKTLIFRSARVESVFILGDLPPNAGFDTVASYRPLYDHSGKVYEIQQINHAFVPNPVLMNVVRFYKKPNSTIGIREASLQSLDVFPNPVEGWFQLEIDTPTDETVKLEVFDVSGRVYKLSMISTEGGLRIDSTPLPDGVYFGRYTDGSGKVVEFKFVK